MKFTFTSLLKIIFILIYAGLVLYTFYGENQAWVNAGKIMLVIFLSMGGLFAFYTYAIREKPVHFPFGLGSWLKPRLAVEQDDVSPIIAGRLVLILLTIAVIAMTCFVWLILTITGDSNAINASGKSLILVKQPGIYDLWLDENTDYGGGGRYVMIGSQNGNIVSGYPAFASAIRKNDDRTQIRACEFNIPSAGMYKLVLPGNNKEAPFVLMPSVTCWSMAAVCASFAIGFISMLICAYIVLSNRVLLPMIRRIINLK